MSWSNIYRAALHLLPAALRRKHGPAMEALFARELARARSRGWVHGVFTGAAAIWDVVRRSAYEQLRPDGDHAVPGDEPTTREVLSRHATSFVIAVMVLTGSVLVVFAARQVPVMSARGASGDTIARALLLAVPFIAALTIPMAVLVAVLREFTRLGADGTLAAARRQRDGIRRLVVPVLGAAACVAAAAFVVTAEIVPRANARLAPTLARGHAASSNRTLTIGELRAAKRAIGSRPGPVAISRAAEYEVEVQKKLALPAACVVMALAGVALALRFPRAGGALVVAASWVVFAAYYALVMIGEELADRLVVPPFVGMWGANALLLAAALFVVWRRRPRLSTPLTE